MSGSRIISKALGQTPPAVISPRAADTTAPSAPGTPSVAYVSDSELLVSFPASTDNDRVAGYAAFIDGADRPFSTSSLNSIRLFNVPPGNHVLVVRAFDTNMNFSASSVQISFESAPGRTIWTANNSPLVRRPVLVGIGNSFIAQDYPTVNGVYSAAANNVNAGGFTYAGCTAVSHLYYFNALCLAAFDYLHGVLPAASINPALNTTNCINGIYGASGRQSIGEIENSIDTLIAYFLNLAGGAPIFAIITLWENDITNNDVSGYWQRAWRTWRRIQSKLIGSGITPILHTPGPSTFINTANKSANWYRIFDLVMNEGVVNTDMIAADVSSGYRDARQVNGYPHPLGYASDLEAVALTGHANARRYSLFNAHADATANAGVHPNARAQVVRALASYRAVLASGKVNFAPPAVVGALSPYALTENSTFEQTTGTVVTGGTNVAPGASVTHRGWQRHAQGLNTQINVTDFNAEFGKLEPVVSIYPAASGAAPDNGGLTGTVQPSSLLVGGLTRLRYFEHVTVHKARNVRDMQRMLRIQGSSFAHIGESTGSGSEPSDQPPDNQLGWRNGFGMLEGQDLVFSSFPFWVDPTPNNGVFNVGGARIYANAPYSADAQANSGSSMTVHSAGLQIVG